MDIDRKFLICAIAYAIVGMTVGVYMGATTDHTQQSAHSHILLAGFVVSFIYGLIHKLWISGSGSTLASIQFYLHQIATVGMTLSLILLYGGALPDTTLGPILGISSVGILLAALLMTYMIFKLPGK